jgi:hypothetical protein
MLFFTLLCYDIILCYVNAQQAKAVYNYKNTKEALYSFVRITSWWWHLSAETCRSFVGVLYFWMYYIKCISWLVYWLEGICSEKKVSYLIMLRHKNTKNLYIIIIIM